MDKKVVKVQKGPSHMAVGIPASMVEAIDGADYMQCSIDENGLHYTPVRL